MQVWPSLSIIHRYLVLSLLLIAQQNAMAWGREGHRISGLIANELLTPNTRSALRDLLGYDDLSLAATWADDYRAPLAGIYPKSGLWHYDDIPLCAPAEKQTYCPNGDCASVRIAKFQALLRDRHALRDKKADAVRFIVHFIGDLQQPLHAANNNDRGGNDVLVHMHGISQATKLHYAWDSLFVKNNLRGRSENELARVLLSEYQAQIPALQAGNLDEWLAESHQLARDVVYDGLDGAFTCPRTSAENTYSLSDEYVKRANSVVRIQLTKAGVRIASLLNRIFAPR